ncbi:MAG: HAMP domain-containing protein, partial [Kofleriaceae bacterium]|nr:HAMP domain-containing protein [Kofleriaceae bacterium]
RPLPERWGKWGVVDNHVDHPLPGGATLALNFAVPDLQPHYKALQQSRAVVEEAQRVRTALPYGLKLSFLIGMGVAGVLAIALGVLASRVITSRIGLLVTAARKISGGQLDARAGLRGNDELAELGASFDTMLDDLDRQRQQIEYLQRIGAWQDVARKLAHEIKNPLTPIQLAVQQCVSAYKGDDERYRKLLADTGEIVEEEIAGLRRLVDTFRTLGALPRVEAQPLDLREVVEELHLDAQLAERLRIEPPADDVTVRADKLLLKRLLTNLCENGVHAGEGAGNPGDVVVGWALASGGRAVAITVDDHGPGVRAEARERIFEPYVTTKATGTGLGLAIAKKIALEHGGDLEIAETPAPTGGARFVVTLPLGDAAA